MRFETFAIVEWATCWNETLEQWRGEGLPADLDRYELYRHFGMDVWHQDWWCPLHYQAPHPAHHGAGIIADAEDYARIRPYLFRIEDEWAKEQAQEKRGLLFATPGSINNGSRLTGMRLIMSAIQRFGRNDGQH